jgi:hypothetical protein
MDCFIVKISTRGDRLSDSTFDLIKERLSDLIKADPKLFKLLDVQGPESLWIVHSTEN